MAICHLISYSFLKLFQPPPQSKQNLLLNNAAVNPLKAGIFKGSFWMQNHHILGFNEKYCLFIDKVSILFLVAEMLLMTFRFTQ